MEDRDDWGDPGDTNIGERKETLKASEPKLKFEGDLHGGGKKGEMARTIGYVGHWNKSVRGVLEGKQYYP